MDSEMPRGVDPEAVAAVLAPVVGGLAGPLRVELIAGGRSNLTYVIGDGEREWVLRRPPLAHVLPTAHDMAREYRVISALTGTGIPVPGAVLLCDDPAVLGVTFYVMERVAGHVVRDALPEAWPHTPEVRRSMSSALITTLADLHAIRPHAVGLGDFGRPAGFLERQVRRWWQQWEASRTRELPEMDELRRRLVEGLPESGAPAIVHGDYRLDNVILAPGEPGRVAAILDWEMSTVGDPLADLGLLLVYWADPRESDEDRALLSLSAITAEPGFHRPAEVVEAYAAATGADLGALEWYVALGHYKLAIVAEGIYARFLMGATVGEGFEIMGARVPRLVRRALDRAGASGLSGLAG
ncbi:MAG TPA: phosphotransferase family protein [Candidatus Dormibacteraeota bacterium]